MCALFAFYILTGTFIKPLIRILCLPDIDKPIGGVKQLYKHVEHLCRLGWDAAVLTEANDFRPSWFTSDAPTACFRSSLENSVIHPSNTILVVPETYVGVNFSDFSGYDLRLFPKVVFNQNAYYSFGSSSVSSKDVHDFYFNNSVLHVLSISQDTHNFLSTNLGIPDSRMSRIINSIEPMFTPSFPKKRLFTWMPRKNPEHVRAVIHSLMDFPSSFSKGWSGFPLQNLSHSDVAQRLNESSIFLSFGHPEGFGLPVAEAMASGCWVVGYSGGGGRELFNYGASSEVSFGDWPNFVSSLHRVFEMFSKYPSECRLLLSRQSLAIKSLYNFDQELSSISVAWERIHQAYSHAIHSVS